VTVIVATLALGSQPRQGVARLRAKKKAKESCRMFPRVQERSLGFMPHAPGSARKCEGIDPHTPKGTPTLGIEVPMDSRMFKERLQGSKPNELKSSLYH